MKLSPCGATSPGSLIRRGSDLGAGTTASPLSRPKASFPSSERIKFKLLLTSLGNGCAGSSHRGLITGSTSLKK